MILTININMENQEKLILGAATRGISVDQFALELLVKGLDEEPKVETLDEALLYPLRGKQPYFFNADPSEPAIPTEEWEMLG
jgi:hypothetical protein